MAFPFFSRLTTLGVPLLLLMLFSILQRGMSGEMLEYTAKVSDGVKASFFSNSGHLPACFSQICPGLLHPDVLEILYQGKACGLLENSAQICAANIKMPCQLLQRQLPGIVGMQIFNHRIHSLLLLAALWRYRIGSGRLYAVDADQQPDQQALEIQMAAGVFLMVFLQHLPEQLLQLALLLY